MKRALIFSCVAVLLASLPVAAQDLTRYVALGDSMTAGYVGGGLMDFYQERSYPALLARQAGTAVFEMPLVSPPGIGPVLRLEALAPRTLIVPSSTTPGAPYNLQYAAPYNNLGVPGADLHDMIFTTGNYLNLVGGTSTPATIMFDMILRDGTYSALQQAIGLDPTFITVFIGNNDILSAAVAATPIEGITMTPVAQFQAEYATAIGALVQNAPDADIVVFTLPYVTAIPFVTTIAPYIDVAGVGRVPLIGSNGPLPENAYVTLAASAYLAAGIGVPTALGGTGLPLPEDLNLLTGQYGVVLRRPEVRTINGRIDAFNDIIRATAAQFGIPVFDFNGVFEDVVAGQSPEFGTIRLSTAFLTGGLFSYDGVHPQNVGQGLIAMYLIDFLNEEFSGNIPQVSMYEIMCENGCEAGYKANHEDLPVFTEEAFEQLKQQFPIKQQQAQRTRKPSGRH